MNFAVEKIEGEYWVSDTDDMIFECGDMYGPFNTYKEATNFMEEQLSILKEYGE